MLYKSIEIWFVSIRAFHYIHSEFARIKGCTTIRIDLTHMCSCVQQQLGIGRDFQSEMGFEQKLKWRPPALIGSRRISPSVYQQSNEARLISQT